MRLTRRRGIGLAVLVALILALTFGFRTLGRFMAPEDPLQRADAIFVLAGTLAERPLEAADLYLEGYAPVILVTQEYPEYALRQAIRRGARIPSRAELNHTVLRQVGIPEAALVLPPQAHDNTAEEAQTLRREALQRKWKRVIVVSSKYHMRRVALICRRALADTGVEIVLRGSRYDLSTPERWWARRSDIRWLLSEVPKFSAYVLGIGTG